MKRTAALVIVLGGLTVFLAMGARQALGLFLSPITGDLGIGRESFSLAVALSNLIFGLPFLGMLADRIGPRLVLLGGALLYAAAFLLLGTISTPAGLYLTVGLLMGLALSAVSYVVVLGAVARVVPAQRRSTAFGLITMAGSLGMFGMFGRLAGDGDLLVGNFASSVCDRIPVPSGGDLRCL